MKQVKRTSMRPAIFILLTLALSAPTLANVLGGADSAIDAGLHLAAAILVAWAAVGFVGYLVDNYRSATLRRAQRQQESIQHQ
jgi:hypothetical protein